MYSITCTGKDGVTRSFVFDDPDIEVTFEGHKEFQFCVKTRPEDIHFFELTLRALSTGEFQIISIENHCRPEYTAMGIPEALLPLLPSLVGGRICSSRQRVINTNEFRTVAATKMWDRLVSKGLAEYYPDEKIYRTI